MSLFDFLFGVSKQIKEEAEVNLIPGLKIEEREKDVFRCSCCGKLALQDCVFVPDGLRIGDDPKEVAQYLASRRDHGRSGWCLNCAIRLSRGS